MKIEYTYETWKSRYRELMSVVGNEKYSKERRLKALGLAKEMEKRCIGLGLLFANTVNKGLPQSPNGGVIIAGRL